MIHPPESELAPRDLFSTRVYVIGEVLLSLVVLVGCGFIMVTGTNTSATNAASIAVGAVITFWFSRRQGEQAVNAVSHIADGKLTSLSTQQASLQRTVEAQMALQTAMLGSQAQASEKVADAANAVADATRKSHGT